MADLVDMFNTELGGDPYDRDDSGMDALEFAEAVGLAETFLDDNQDQDFDNVESLFDNDNEAHEEAERVSLKNRNDKNNVPNFERFVMKKCGLL